MKVVQHKAVVANATPKVNLVIRATSGSIKSYSQ